MVARTRLTKELWVVLYDDAGVAIDHAPADGPTEAVKVSIIMLARREALFDGMALRVQTDVPR